MKTALEQDSPSSLCKKIQMYGGTAGLPLQLSLKIPYNNFNLMCKYIFLSFIILGMLEILFLLAEQTTVHLYRHVA
jgi:hypothetical protein